MSSYTSSGMTMVALWEAALCFGLSSKLGYPPVEVDTRRQVNSRLRSGPEQLVSCNIEQARRHERHVHVHNKQMPT
jgi:hypothetical protein